MPTARPSPPSSGPAPIGALLRTWRDARGKSQEWVAARAGVSTRHLSFIETGRAAPGRDVVLALAGALDVPLRTRNELLLAAGHAPGYGAAGLGDADLAMVRRALDLILDHHEPFPAVVFDRLTNVVRMNRGGLALFTRFAPPALPPALAQNVLLALLHPDGWKPFVVNWDELAGDLIERLHRDLAAAPGDRALAALAEQALALPDVPHAWRRPRWTAPVQPCAIVHLRRGELELRLFTTITMLGTPLDVTAEELRIESYFPVDAATEALLRGWALPSET
ncbi:MAG: helix-turn-helix domain-containing protein [Deltaproteobacteria bacterium]|nr:helix-turn-helix domain-containing protein [Deltaproteobacteria bacterium]